MATRVRIKKVDTRALKKRFRGMIRRSTDFSSVFRWAHRQMQDAQAKNFDSRGAVSGGVWAPLDSGYAAWKLEHYGAKGVLVRTGDLRSSLTSWNARGAVREVGATTAFFGTDIPYSGFIQYGTSNMPSRSFTFVPRSFATRVARATGEHIVYGTEVGEIYSHLKDGIFG